MSFKAFMYLRVPDAIQKLNIFNLIANSEKEKKNEGQMEENVIFRVIE